ncbi:hypothetical protein CFII68_25429 [Pseudomonas sp. CFII68]|nr:hypothetical protein CFII68_25429 [Pseudomonas sp. CFII68]
MLPFAFSDMQSLEIAGLRYFGVLSIAQSQNVGSATSINSPAERAICADVDQVIGLSQFHAFFAGGDNTVMLSVCSFFERFETLLKLGRRRSLGR